MEQSALARELLPKVGRIAYLADDGNVGITDQAGGSVAVTSDATDGGSSKVGYTAPVWSRDGKRVVFARLAGSRSAEVLVADRDGGGARVILSTDSLAPFFFSWSPDDSLIGILSEKLGVADSTELGVVSAARGNDYRVVHTDAPIFWVWLPDSSGIVAHTQVGPGEDAPDFIEIYGLSGGRTDERIENIDLGAFDAPAVSQDGRKLLLPLGTSEKARLTLLDPAGQDGRVVARPSGSVSYSVSPDGERVAYVDQATPNDVETQALHIVSLKDPRASFEVKERPVIEFFWAPDGREVAFIVPAQAGEEVDPAFAQGGNRSLVELRVVDVGSRQSWSIARYPMTPASLEGVPFNDQSQAASTIWSPDGKYLVFSAVTKDGTNGIFVASSDGNLNASECAHGDLPTWSWK